ncbi:MAG TPA: cyclic nucleotide-binding domain-containing protein [Acidimicrobiia bacterium]|nr:cyclic nucleotide-binding domain-containing protein [Acidimicrobiia bacterium]
MHHESSVTSISWIPTEAMSGLLAVPMDLGIGHYDLPPPDRVEADDLESLRLGDKFRFANHLAAWAEVEDGRIVDAGYSGGGYVGSTTAKFGTSITVPGVSFPLLQDPPKIEGDRVRFVQTAGGRTGMPMPRRIDRPPFVRMTSPTAWTTLGLELDANGNSEFELVGASPFPRHWIYGSDGELAAKSGIIDYNEWLQRNDHVHSPWHDFDRPMLMALVESQIEHNVSPKIMSDKHESVTIEAGSNLIEQGQPGGPIYLILDGMLIVTVDGEEVAQLGPGAIVGEMAILEGGFATATVTAMTPVRAAKIPAEVLDLTDLEGIAAAHGRDESGT